jgi:hypothetical protein
MSFTAQAKTLVECEERIIMIRKASLFLCILIFASQAGCNLFPPPGGMPSNEEAANKYKTVSVMLTETARATVITTPVVNPQPTQTRTPLNTPQPQQTIVITEVVTLPVETTSLAGIQTQVPPCDLAQAGRPIDVTIPDDTRFYPGDYFSKTWRLVNAGSCDWTRDYALVWFSGEDLGVTRVQPFNAVVKPGQSVDVTVEMLAPRNPGTYQSNWKLRNNQGVLFGIGHNGGSPFWARIIVVPIDTPTVTPLPPEPTPTTPVYVSGTLFLEPGDGVDLDHGQVNTENDNDVFFTFDEETSRYALTPHNLARLMPFPDGTPELLDCALATLSADPLMLDELQPGGYICYRTGDGLPGRMSVSEVDIDNGQLTLNFYTWAIP